MPEATKAKYRVGQVVYHKATGMKGVIVEAIQRCIVHPLRIGCILFPWQCIYAFAGCYRVSFGVTPQDKVICDEAELIPAASNV